MLVVAERGTVGRQSQNHTKGVRKMDTFTIRKLYHLRGMIKGYMTVAQDEIKRLKAREEKELSTFSHGHIAGSQDVHRRSIKHFEELIVLASDIISEVENA